MVQSSASALRRLTLRASKRNITDAMAIIGKAMLIPRMAALSSYAMLSKLKLFREKRKRRKGLEG